MSDAVSERIILLWSEKPGSQYLLSKLYNDFLSIPDWIQMKSWLESFCNVRTVERDTSITVYLCFDSDSEYAEFMLKHM